MRTSFAALSTLVLASTLAGTLALRAQEGDQAAEEEEAAAPVTAIGKRPRTMGKDKAGIEAYLKHRLAVMKKT
ncbi:MAG: hypothetical protein HY554_14735, partial [Elusimicrobia bacterium]|nr:hypothetical protein [Elusimicrobiota bacterium]